MTKQLFLETAAQTLGKALSPERVYPCEIGEVDHHLWLRGNQSAARKNKGKRSAGYWDVSLVPLKRRPFVVIRIWTLDGGSGINAKLSSANFPQLVCTQRHGLKWRYSPQKGGVPISGHGLYDFYRDVDSLSGVSMKTLIDDFVVIEKALTSII